MAKWSSRRIQPRRQPPSSSGRTDLGTVLLGALAIIVGSTVLGIAVNHFAPRGIPLLGGDIEGAPALSLPPGILRMSLAETKAAVEAQSALFLDARTDYEYAEGHIPGALNLPAYEFEERFPDLADLIEEAPSLVVYCGGIECSDATEIAERLLEVGHTDVYVFESGWQAWIDSGGAAKEGRDP